MRLIKLWNISVWFLFTTGCSMQGQDCSTGPDRIPDEEVAELVPIDSAFFPAQIRQGMRFKSDTIELNFYTNGITKSTIRTKIGGKSVQGRCGNSVSDYILVNKENSLVYNSLAKDKAFVIKKVFLLHFNSSQVNTKNFVAHECTMVNILGRDFFIDSKDFDVNDSNKVSYHSTLTLNGKVYSNVYKIERDTPDVMKKLPFECYYSNSHSGLIGFRITGQPIYMIDN